MRVLVRITPGPRWLPGRSVYRQGPLVEAHLDYMRERFDDRSLLIGGPLRSGMAGVAVLDVPDLMAAKKIADCDPAVDGGVLVYSADELVPFFDVTSGARAGGPSVGASRRAQP